MARGLALKEANKINKTCWVHKYFDELKKIMDNKNFNEEKKNSEFLKLSNDKDILFTFIKKNDFFYFSLNNLKNV